MKGLRLAIPTAFAFSTLALVACEQDRVTNVPAGATVMTSGNANLTFTAPSDGTVWVYDQNDDRIDYSGQIRASQSLTLDPQSSQILIDGRVVNDKTLNQNAQHRVYFQAVNH
jgi:hypothetical protein